MVRWSDKSKGKQKGQIQDVDIYVDLKLVGTNHVLKNISSKKLMPLEVRTYLYQNKSLN